MSSFDLSSARAAASRRNGAKSKGPKTAEGKARSSQNAIKHGLRARKWVVLHGESETEFKRLEAALIEELAPEGVLQSLLAQQVAAAAWRLGRANQIETQLFAANSVGAGSRSLGRAVIRDCNNPRALDTLMRYRGGTQAEFYRALRTLKALQAEARIGDTTPAVREASAPAPALAVVTPATAPTVRAPAPAAQPDEPERHENPGDSAPAVDRAERHQLPAPAWLRSLLSMPRKPAPCAAPIEPDRRSNPAGSVPRPAGEAGRNRRTSLLAGTALVSAHQPRGPLMGA